MVMERSFRKSTSVLAVLSLCCAASLKASVSSLPFLAHGGRAGALGGAFASVADDAEAVLYNPAGTVTVRDAEAGLFYMSRGESFMSKNHVAALDMVFPAQGYGLGVGLVYEASPAEGEHNFLATASSANYVARVVALGLGVQYLQSTRESRKASVVGGSAGAILSSGPLSFGISLQNWQGSLKYDGLTEKPADVLRFGIAYREPGSGAPLAVEYRRVIGAETRGSVHAGIEVPAISEKLILRLGYSRFVDSGEDSFLFGLGLRLFEQMDARSRHPLGFELNAYDDLRQSGFHDSRVELRRRRI